jgi:hypothetical protein
MKWKVNTTTNRTTSVSRLLKAVIPSVVSQGSTQLIRPLVLTLRFVLQHFSFVRNHSVTIAATAIETAFRLPFGREADPVGLISGARVLPDLQGLLRSGWV